MNSWHDYHLTGYSVDGERKSIEFKLSWPYESEDNPKNTLLVFSQVESYFFEHDLGHNIIASIEEIPIESFLQEHFAFFEAEQKWGWPAFWKESINATAHVLNEKEIKVWEISTSYGLNGWVVARNIQSKPNQPAPADLA